jgi:hypothetical protein
MIRIAMKEACRAIMEAAANPNVKAMAEDAREMNLKVSAENMAAAVAEADAI